MSLPAEVLPRWCKGIKAAVVNAVHRDLLLFGLCTGMRRGEIFPLRWDRAGLEASLFRIEDIRIKRSVFDAAHAGAQLLIRRGHASRVCR